ncbi:zeta-sarcoglycan-like isoform X4 [Brachyistius frenatus]|uniref:zeta-sarcoglycan-like isoform X4 n=1 Tax=Brachyistius frenatus TaxID=100188 RepID=UPI0037E76560
MCAFSYYPGAVYPGVPVPAPPAPGLRRRVPGGPVRLEETMPVFLPAAAPGHHDSEPGPHRLDHQGHEFLRGRDGEPPAEPGRDSSGGNQRVPVASLCERDPVQEGPEAVEAQCQRLEVRSQDRGKLLFTADEEEVFMTTEKFIVTGSEGAAFGRSVETPLIRARASEDLKLESPTRTLTMEAPRGVEVSAAKGPLKVSGRKDLHLESTEGEILLDANSVQLGRLPLAVFAPSPGHASPEQAAYELCVCPSGKIYRSPAESSSTCQAMSNICLWS